LAHRLGRIFTPVNDIIAIRGWGWHAQTFLNFVTEKEMESVFVCVCVCVYVCACVCYSSNFFLDIFFHFLFLSLYYIFSSPSHVLSITFGMKRISCSDEFSSKNSLEKKVQSLLAVIKPKCQNVTIDSQFLDRLLIYCSLLLCIPQNSTKIS